MTAHVKHILDRTRLRGRRRDGGGFTLIELLVVISIIVLLLALAVPLIGSLRGGRSVDSGQNIVSAMLQRARARAIGIQQRRGVFFFDDTLSGKTGMLLVKVLDGTPNTLELDDENVEIEYLPNGIGVAGLLGSVTTVSGTPTTDFRPNALIVFDGVGRIETLDQYKINPAPPAAATSILGDKYRKDFKDNVWNEMGTRVAQPEASQTAFVLYDRRGLADQAENLTTNQIGVRFSPEQSKWLDQDAVAIVVNRYNGTLIRGE
jgi:prepilin-type N-terminal cleavage/methylation domain-containing protein